MRRLLVVSDNHGALLCDELYEYVKPDLAVHLGDSEFCYDSDDLGNYIKIAGNCDFDSSFLESSLVSLGDVTFLAVHGHKESLFSGVVDGIILHGHTHVMGVNVVDGVYYVNPGSVSMSRCSFDESFLVVEISGRELLLKFMAVRDYRVLLEKKICL